MACSCHARADYQQADAEDGGSEPEPPSEESLALEQGMLVAVSPNGAESVLRSLADRRPHQVFALLLILMDPDSVGSSDYISPLTETGLDAQMPAGVSSDHAHRLIDHAFTEDGTWSGVTKMLTVFETMGYEMAGMNDGMLYTRISIQTAKAGASGRLTLDTYTEAACEVDADADAGTRATLHGPTFIDYQVEQIYPELSPGPRSLTMIRLEKTHF